MRRYEARFDLDTRCNYRCIYCLSFKNESGDRGPYPKEYLEKTFQFVNKTCWSIFLSCAGEPLLYPDFGYAIDCVNRYLQDVDVSIVTNGYLLNDKNIEIFSESKIPRIFVSIDSIKPDVYGHLCSTSAGRVEEIKTNIAKLTSRVKNSKVILIAIAMKSTLPYLQDLAEWAVKTGVDGVRIHWLTTNDPILIQNESISKHDAYPILKQVGKYLKSKNLYFDFPYATSWQKVMSVLGGLSAIKNKTEYVLYNVNKFISSNKKVCRVAGSLIDISSDTSVWACPGRKVKVGLIKDESVPELIKSLRKRLGEIRSKNSNCCADCTFNE